MSGEPIARGLDQFVLELWLVANIEEFVHHFVGPAHTRLPRTETSTP